MRMMYAEQLGQRCFHPDGDLVLVTETKCEVERMPDEDYDRY